jgi:hypothetical protein
LISMSLFLLPSHLPSSSFLLPPSSCLLFSSALSLVLVLDFILLGDLVLFIFLGSADVSRLQSFKRDTINDPQRGDSNRVEIIIRPPLPRKEERVEVLEGELVSPYFPCSYMQVRLI